MYGIRPSSQAIKVRGRDKSAPIKRFRIATGHVAVMKSGTQRVKVAVRELPSPGAQTYRGVVIAADSVGKAPAEGTTRDQAASPRLGAESDFTLRNVFRVEV